MIPSIIMMTPNLSLALPLLLLLLFASSAAGEATSPPPTSAPRQCNVSGDVQVTPYEKTPVRDICRHAVSPEGCVVAVRYLSSGGVKATTAVAVVKYHLDACLNAANHSREEVVAHMNTPGMSPDDKERLRPILSACDEAIRCVKRAMQALLKSPADADGVIDNTSLIPGHAKKCEQTRTSVTAVYVDNALSIVRKYWNVSRPAAVDSSASEAPSGARDVVLAICDATSDSPTCMSFVEDAEALDKTIARDLTNAAAVLRLAVKATIAETKNGIKIVKEIAGDPKLDKRAKPVLARCDEELNGAVAELDEAGNAMKGEEGGDKGVKRQLQSARKRIRASRDEFTKLILDSDLDFAGREDGEKLQENQDFLPAAADVVMDLADMVWKN